MRHWVGSTIILGALAVLMSSGCASPTRSHRWNILLNYPHAEKGTLSMSSEEHFQEISNVADRDARALYDDLDLLFMTDRPTRLTRWHSR